MTVSITKSLFDIRESINAVHLHLGNTYDFLVYRNNLTIKRAVERELEIIGEAVSRILKEDPDFQLTNARKIVNLRNYIIHGYDAIDDETIWGVVVKHLPLLKAEIDTMLTDS